MMEVERRWGGSVAPRTIESPRGGGPRRNGSPRTVARLPGHPPSGSPLAEGGNSNLATETLAITSATSTVATPPAPRIDGISEALRRATLVAGIGADYKARDILILDMRRITPLYDYVVIMSGASRRQIHTLAEEIDAALRATGERRLHMEGYEASKWVVQDYGDVVIHVFDPETRTYYALEELWADAPRVAWEHP